MNSYEEVHRIASLFSSDPAFFCLATHSYIEAFLRSRYGLSYQEDEERFCDLVNRLRDELWQQGHFHDAATRKKSGSLWAINAYQRTVNAVRHEFKQVAPEEAEAALKRFIDFIALAEDPSGESTKELATLLKRQWDARSKADLSLELEAAMKEAESLKRDRARLDEELKAMRELRREKERLESEKLKADEELARALKALEDTKETSAKRGERIDALRKKANELERAIAEKERSEAALERAKSYLDAQLAQSLVARARGDYERELLRLSAEQQGIVDTFKGKGDFLVRGAAGTGKTIVLLKCLEKLARDEDYRLGLEEKPRFKLLTYANALRNYDAYLWTLLGKDKARGDEVETADSLLRKLFIEAFDGKDITYGTGALPDINEAFKSEIVLELLEGGLTKEAYLSVEGGAQRAAMREAAWAEFERAFASVEESPRWPACYAYWRLLVHYDEKGFEAPFDYVFLDEAQDLSPAQLKLIKRCAKRGLVMAADADQAIYKSGFSYSRLGIDLKGKSKILKGNYRNTIEILELAEAFRQEAGGGASEERKAIAWRHGPRPDIRPCKSGDIVSAAVSSYEHLAEDLGYAPETIVIAAPKKSILDQIRMELEARGVHPATTDELKHPSFDFGAAGSPRLLTLQSCKGLDFAAAIIVLEGIFDLGETGMRQIYVGLTRPMEQLAVVFDEDSRLAPIEALRRAARSLKKEKS